MQRSAWKTYLIWILGVEAVGALSGFLTRGGAEFYAQSITKPPLSPPGIVFPIVWSVLYLLMGVSGAKIAMEPASPARRRALWVFAVQLGFNFFWSIIFFNLQNFGFAFFWLMALWGLIIWMILAFRSINPAAGWLQLPYFVWVTFAAYLNFGVWVLNR